MPAFGKSSSDKLATCQPDLQKVMNAVIKRVDITILYGHRTPAEQLELFKQGRKFEAGRWIKVGATVTDKDGTHKLSKHNYLPSKAVDIAPYPIDWNNIQRFIDVAKIVMEEAEKLGIKLVWGADWDGDGNIAEHSLQDYPHFEVVG